MRLLVLMVFLSLSVYGCACSFSGIRGYREYVQKDIQLLRPVHLIEMKQDIPRSSRYLNPHYVEIPAGTLFKMEPSAAGRLTGFALPAGTHIRIREIVCQAVSGSSLEIQARGVVFVPALMRDVNFLYVYPYESQCVRRAPWEGEQWPLWRKFDTGKVEWCEKSSVYFEKKYRQ